jgi:hypothetical protein
MDGVCCGNAIRPRKTSRLLNFPAHDYADGINSPVSDEIGSPIDLKQGEMLLLSK